MALKSITLSDPISNISLQVGDTVYSAPAPTQVGSTGIWESSGDPVKAGTVKSISGNSVTIEEAVGFNANVGDFLMFSKNKSVNNTSLVGYFAEVKLKNNSTERAELFALSSEVIPSSK